LAVMCETYLSTIESGHHMDSVMLLEALKMASEVGGRQLGPQLSDAIKWTRGLTPLQCVVTLTHDWVTCLTYGRGK
jgi:hypothetical protein